MLQTEVSIWLQKSALIQPQTSLVKFGHFTEEFEKDTVSYLSTKVARAAFADAAAGAAFEHEQVQQ